MSTPARDHDTPSAPLGGRGRRLAAWLVLHPERAWSGLVLVSLAALLGAVMHVAGREPRVAPGVLLDRPWVVRAAFTVEDRAGTESRRQAARLRAPRVYAADTARLDELRSGLENLPRALADAGALGEVDAQIRARYGVSEETLSALRQIARDAGAAQRWDASVGRLLGQLRRTPLVEAQSFQREALAANDRARLLIGDEPPVNVPTENVLDLGAERSAERLRALAVSAGFEGPALSAVVGALDAQTTPTFRFDTAQTEALAQQAAAAVRPLTTTYVPGQTLAVPGEPLSAATADLLRAEHAAHRAGSSLGTLLARDMGLWGAALLAALGVGAYAATYAPGLWRSPMRMLAVAALAAGALAGACGLAAFDPRAMPAAAALPALLFTMVLAVAYDRRTALALGSLMGILACVALDQPVATIGVALSGVWMAAWRLRTFRHRQTLVHAGVAAGVGIAVSTLLLAGLARPMTGPAWTQALVQAAQGGIGAVLVGLIVLGSIPLLERAFDTCTGMTLIELRDPQHPLQRLLQMQAPGTYSHSLNVAGLAEAAAQAIGADGLTTYVGALYHDVGKAAKPEYFVENQTGSFNRHDRLAPAMSLLVIVGHVREGLELARQHRLPRVLHHFIESHHGTTLVEYFYHRARKQAEAAHAGGGAGPPLPPPAEIEYRYPGPKPRTREAAIVMVCDAAESAARSTADPTPARVEALVRAIAHKRLMDGQFDDCDLSLRDLAAIIETVSKALAAIHHPRIAYPEAAGPATPQPAATGPRTAGPTTGVIDTLPGPASTRREAAQSA